MKKSNYIYLYDNDFISLLSLIKILIAKKVIPCNIKPNTYTPSLFEETFKEQISENEIHSSDQGCEPAHESPFHRSALRRLYHG